MSLLLLLGSPIASVSADFSGIGVLDATTAVVVAVLPAAPSQWNQAVVSSSATEVCYVQIWDPQLSQTTPIVARAAPIDGSVTADFATGVRRTLSATFDPTMAPFLYPGVELRPFAGFNYGSGAHDVLPLGCFPLTATDIDISPASPISVSPQDRWQWITGTTFPTPYSTVATATVKSQLTKLVTDTGQWSAAQVSNSISSNAKAAVQTWDSDRSQAIADLCKVVGAEAFVSRVGTFILRDRRAAETPTVTITGLDGGRLLDGHVTTDTSDVYNSVYIVPANTDPAFVVAPVRIRITDSTHPAYPGPGVISRSFRLDSAQFKDTIQAKAAGQKILTRISAKAQQTFLTCAPDWALDEGDTVAIVHPGLPPKGQIQQITYPLTVGDTQQITTVSTRSDEDFQP